MSDKVIQFNYFKKLYDFDSVFMNGSEYFVKMLRYTQGCSGVCVFRQYRRICLTVRASPQVVHGSGSSRLTRWRCVSQVCPIYLFIILYPYCRQGRIGLASYRVKLGGPLKIWTGIESLFVFFYFFFCVKYVQTLEIKFI